MSKERLEDWEKAIIQCDKTKKVIIKLVDENTTLTERVQELERDNEYLRDVFIPFLQANVAELERQNKRYREAIDEIENAWKLTKSYQEHLDIIQEIIKGLEDEE